MLQLPAGEQNKNMLNFSVTDFSLSFSTHCEGIKFILQQIKVQNGWLDCFVAKQIN
jgi:hypothetical protein